MGALHANSAEKVKNEVNSLHYLVQAKFQYPERGRLPQNCKGDIKTEPVKVSNRKGNFLGSNQDWDGPETDRNRLNVD
eukprot:1750023-Prymnesium_polylepis.1